MATNQVSHDSMAARIAGLLAAFTMDPPGAESVPADGPWAESLARFFSTLLDWNRRINLTGARSGEDLVDLHLPDALALAHLIPPRARLIDVGSGGGLPALPLAVVRPDLTCTLVEPRAKRAAFLKTATRELRLANVRVETCRIEDLPSADGAFDCACSRATFEPEIWIPVGLRLVRPGGRVYVLHAKESAEAFSAAFSPSATRILTAQYDLKGHGRRKVTVMERST